MDKINTIINYEYQILRYRHDVTSGEFVNIGIVFFDVENRKLLARMTEKQARIAHFFGYTSCAVLLKTIKHIEQELNNSGKKWRNNSDTTVPKSITDFSNPILPINDNGLFFSEVHKGWHFSFQTAFNTTFHRLVGQYTGEKTAFASDNSTFIEQEATTTAEDVREKLVHA